MTCFFVLKNEICLAKHKDIGFARNPIQIANTFAEGGPIFPEVIGELQCCANFVVKIIKGLAFLPSNHTHNRFLIGCGQPK